MEYNYLIMSKESTCTFKDIYIYKYIYKKYLNINTDLI
jgi:hypothetical protein